MNKQNKYGFTLAELLIVVAIIAVLVAIAIPIFTSQLEKSRDAVTMANLRSAYAEAAAQVLEAENPTAPITISVTAKGTQDGWHNIEPSNAFSLGSGTNVLEGTPGTYEVTFTFTTDDKCIATVEG